MRLEELVVIATGKGDGRPGGGLEGQLLGNVSYCQFRP
jgi:hypothetical protein